MHNSLFILGRQPALGLAELENLYGAENLRPVGREATLLHLDPASVDFARLGGSVKLCKVLATFNTIKWPELQQSLEQTLPPSLMDVPEGKIRLGLSVYGLNIRPQQLMAAGLNLKKALRTHGRSARLVPNQSPALNSAQVLHNNLLGDLGCEIVCVRDGSKTICAQTIAEQNITSYTLRDRGRPKRDARVGMLPPKLAQIIINLAGKHAPPANATADPEHPANGNPQRARLLDPFCGTGVVLQEALLMGYDAYGTDLEPRMIDYTQTNLDWLREQFDFGGKYDLTAGDATTFAWQQSIDIIASETYLGQPYTTVPPTEKLAANIHTCNLIAEKFLTNIGGQLKAGTRLCLALPAWQTSPNKFRHLPLVDRISEMGYNRVSFEHVGNDDLIYYRENQIVARELLVITRK